MRIFDSPEEKERKAVEKERKAFEKYGMQDLTDPQDVESIKKIMQLLVGSNISETGMRIAMSKPEVMLPITYQRAIMEQNFVIIRLLNRIANKLEG